MENIHRERVFAHNHMHKHHFIKAIIIVILLTFFGYILIPSFNPNLPMYSLMHLECGPILIVNLNLMGLFSMKRGKRDLENTINNF